MRTSSRIQITSLVVILIAPTAFAQSPPTKEPAAIALLARMAAATGWNPVTVPADAVATGTVTRFQGETRDTVAVTLKAKGARRFRTEVQQGASVTSTIVNGAGAAVLSPQATRWIPAHAVLAMRPMAFPFLSDLVATGDASVVVRYLGTETVRGEAAHKVEVFREPPTDDPTPEFSRRASRLVVWVSTVSGLPLQIEYRRIASDNATALSSHLRSFSDYRRVGGLLIPFHQEETLNGQPLLTLQLTQVQFNVGLPDSDFALPATGK